MADVKNIPYWGVDSDPKNRPGVPMEASPRRDPDAHWREPERQTPTTEILKRSDLEELTPVFGTCQPPHGISGIIKRYAYTIPEHQASRWMLLLFSDRVDALESQVMDTIRNPWFILSVTLSAGTAFYLMKAPKVKANFSTEGIAA
jgi:hypothetical protein